MLNLTDSQARRILRPLYNTAEKDANDIIANAASALAVRLETPKSVHVISDLEKRIIHHALKNHAVAPVSTAPRRKTYKRRVSLA
jgi:hypothetical protein